MPVSDDRPLILFYNSWFGGDPPAHDLGSALWTRDVARLPEAAIVVLNMPEVGRSTLRGLPKHPGQLWASMSFESDANYPLQANPAITSLFDLSISFDRRATIRKSSVLTVDEWNRVMSLPVPDKTETAPVVMFQSATTDQCGRTAYAEALAAHVQVDSYGKVLNNRQLPAGDLGIATKLATISRYKFCIGFENTRQIDYVTEKLFQPLLAGSVPVYRGAPNATELAPPNSFIDADDFGGPRELADYLVHLSNAPEEYRTYLAWRSAPLPDSVLALAQEIERPLFERLSDFVPAHFPRYGGPGGRPKRPFGLWSYLRLRFRSS